MTPIALRHLARIEANFASRRKIGHPSLRPGLGQDVWPQSLHCLHQLDRSPENANAPS